MRSGGGIWFRAKWQSEDTSPTVVFGTLNCLARLFRFAIKLGDLSASPMSAVERDRAGGERVTPTLMVEEVDRLAAVCDQVSWRYGDYVRLVALLGLRAGELTALQVGNVNLTTGVARRSELVGELGWPGLHFHDLRAPAIVLWIRAGVRLTRVRALAGHASSATTDRYARIARNDLAGGGAGQLVHATGKPDRSKLLKRL